MSFLPPAVFQSDLRLWTLVWIMTVLGCLPLALMAQTTSLTGIVRDKSTNETLTGAAVLVKGTANGSFIDLDGQQLISEVNPSKVTLGVFCQVNFVLSVYKSHKKTRHVLDTAGIFEKL